MIDPCCCCWLSSCITLDCLNTSQEIASSTITRSKWDDSRGLGLSQTLRRGHYLQKPRNRRDGLAGSEVYLSRCVLLPFPGCRLWWRLSLLGLSAPAVQQSKRYFDQSFIKPKYSSREISLQCVEWVLWEEDIATSQPHLRNKLLNNSNEKCSLHIFLRFSGNFYVLSYKYSLLILPQEKSLCGLSSISSNAYWPSQSRLWGSPGVCAY